MNLVLINFFGGLSLPPSKNVLRLIECPNMTIAVYLGCKQQLLGVALILLQVFWISFVTICRQVRYRIKGIAIFKIVILEG